MLTEAAESLSDRLARRCRALLDIPSVSRDEQAVEAYIKAALPASLEIAYDHDSVFYAAPRQRGDRPLVVLVGHTDTVPIENNLPSSRHGDVIFGRGASDMKSGVAVALEMAQWIDEHPTEATMDLGFLFFGREELAAHECPLLDALQANSLLTSADFAIVMEPTANNIEAGCVGNLVLKTTYTGVASHSGRPWLGRNAVHIAVQHLQDVATAGVVDVDVDGLTFREAASVTEFSGGVASNVIPAQAGAIINVRYAPSRDAHAIEREWHEKLAAEHVFVETVSNARSAPVVVDHPLTKALQVAGAGPARAKQAWTNVSDFAQVGMPAINFGPADPVYAHKADEQVTVSALVECFETLQAFVRGNPNGA